MATVTDVVVQQQDAGAGERKKVYYTVVITTNNNDTVTHKLPPVFMMPPDDPVAKAPEYGASVLAGFVEDEKRNIKERVKTEPYVLHNDMGGWYEKKTLDYNTWDDGAGDMLKDYLSREDMLELADIVNDVTQISNGDMRALLGISNPQVSDIRADIQIAVNTRATLNGYVPFLDEDGNWNRS